MDEQYRFSERTYQTLGQAGIDWRHVLDVLHGPGPRYRQHIGAVLRIVSTDRHGVLLAVTLIEEDDDGYEVVTARRLGDDEAQTIWELLGGRR